MGEKKRKHGSNSLGWKLSAPKHVARWGSTQRVVIVSITYTIHKTGLVLHINELGVYGLDVYAY